MPKLDILYEDNHLLVVNKPAGIATMGAESGPTVHSLAANYLKRTYDKPGRVFVGIVSRLDTMTSGVLVLARTSKAASRLSTQFAAKSKSLQRRSADSQTPPEPKNRPKESATRKIYLAVIEGSLDSTTAILADRVRKDEKAHRMRIVGPSVTDAQTAELRYTVIGTSTDTTPIAVELLTGRKHQIRVQFADRGNPIIGDRKYDSRRQFSSGIALHSWRLEFTHPTKRTTMRFETPPPETWKPFRRMLGTPNEMTRRITKAFDLSLEVTS